MNLAITQQAITTIHEHNASNLKKKLYKQHQVTIKVHIELLEADEIPTVPLRHVYIFRQFPLMQL